MSDPSCTIDTLLLAIWLVSLVLWFIAAVLYAADRYK
jgi:hypothetical protein